MISVIITAYNIENYISQCLDSILGQTYEDLEIIVVNDGSTDRTESILQKYVRADHRIRMISQENQGAGIARNMGLEQASGEYTAILDGDDFFETHMLEHALEKMESEQADIVIFDANYYDNVEKRVGKLDTALKEEFIPESSTFNWRDIPEKIFNISDGFVWNKLYRHSFLEKYHLRFQDVRRIDDLLFEMEALIKADKITVLNERLCYYRCNNSTSQQGCATQTPDTFYIAFMAVKEWLQKEGIYEKVARSFANRALFSCINNLELMKTGSAFERQYNNLKNKYFSDLGILWKKEYYYDQRNAAWLDNIMKLTPAEYLFEQLEKMKKANGGLEPNYIFPAHLIPKDSRIVLYGAGKVGRSYYAQLLNSQYCKVVLWVDKGYERIGEPVKAPEKICHIPYDYLLIAIQNDEIAKEIQQELVGMGINKNTIKWSMESGED